MSHETRHELPSDHPLRVALSEIMHDRSLQISTAQLRIRQWLILYGEEGSVGLADWLEGVSRGRATPDCERYFEQGDESSTWWEKHTEFSTITIIRFGASSQQSIEECPWLAGIPGSVFRSIEILLGRESDFLWEDEVKLVPLRLVSSLAFGGAARICSDFTIKGNGAGKILVEDRGLQNDEASRLVQTLLEIGNYRKLALLGFPIARDLMPWITNAEARHAAITEKMNSSSYSREEVLADLLDLSSEVEFRAGRARYRLGATSSYNLLTRDRLAALREVRLDGYSTWAEFIERRLLPAMRTCEITQARLDSLSERINRSASLLSLEQSVALNKRNQAALLSMNRRARLQLRLQSLVEGFSIFAISYYIISLLDHLVEPVFHNKALAGWKDTIIASAVPLILAASWFFLKRRRMPSHAVLSSNKSRHE